MFRRGYAHPAARRNFMSLSILSFFLSWGLKTQPNYWTNFLSFDNADTDNQWTKMEKLALGISVQFIPIYFSCSSVQSIPIYF